MRTGTKALALGCVAYMGSVLLAGVAAGVVLLLMSPRSCASYGRALVAVWIAMGIAFLAGLLLAGLAAMGLEVSRAARAGLVGALGVGLFGTYIVLALGLMVAFNC